MERINLAQPRLSDHAKQYVMDCLDTNWISSNGKYITEFEEAFAAYCGVAHAVATSNGTTALHAALLALGVGPGDEVIVPTLTYIASANAVRYCGAEPVFIDADPGTLTLDPDHLAACVTERTRGIMPVHLYGHPADMLRVNEFADQHGLFVLEDAAQAHGARVGDRKVGALGTAATFSFFGNKIVTTGEGGIITTDDDELANRMRLLRGQGMDPRRRYRFPIIGYNYRMTNIQAAIGLSQIERIDEAIAARASVAERYRDRLSRMSTSIEWRADAPWATPVTWMFNVYLRWGGEPERDLVMQLMDADGIETRPVFYPVHAEPPYDTGGDFPVSAGVAARGISLPTHEGLSDADIDRVVRALEQAVERAQASFAQLSAQH